MLFVSQSGFGTTGAVEAQPVTKIMRENNNRLDLLNNSEKPFVAKITKYFSISVSPITFTDESIAAAVYTVTVAALDNGSIPYILIKIFESVYGKIVTYRKSGSFEKSESFEHETCSESLCG